MSGYRRPWQAIVATYWDRYLIPEPFKPLEKPPVKGGRWMIRKLRVTPESGKAWRAWSRGASAGMKRFFSTQQDAIAYAEGVARLFKDLPDTMIDRAHRIIELYPDITNPRLLSVLTATVPIKKPRSRRYSMALNTNPDRLSITEDGVLFEYSKNYGGRDEY